MTAYKSDNYGIRALVDWCRKQDGFHFEMITSHLEEKLERTDLEFEKTKERTIMCMKYNGHLRNKKSRKKTA